MKSANYEKLAAIFKEVLDLAPDRDPRNAIAGDDWSWDSLAHVSLVVALESEFSVSIDVDASLSMTSFLDSVRILAAAGVTFSPEELP